MILKRLRLITIVFAFYGTLSAGEVGEEDEYVKVEVHKHTIAISSHSLQEGIKVYFKGKPNDPRFRLWRVSCGAQTGFMYDGKMYFNLPFEHDEKSIFTIEGSDFYQDCYIAEGKLLPITPPSRKESTFLIDQDFLPDEPVNMGTKLLRALINSKADQEGKTFLGYSDCAVVKVVKTIPEIGGFYLEYQGNAAEKQIGRINKFRLLHNFRKLACLKIKDAEGNALSNPILVKQEDLNDHTNSTFILSKPIRYEQSSEAWESPSLLESVETEDGFEFLSPEPVKHESFGRRFQSLSQVVFVKTEDGFEFLASDFERSDFVVQYQGSQTPHFQEILSKKGKDKSKKG